MKVILNNYIPIKKYITNKDRIGIGTFTFNRNIIEIGFDGQVHWSRIIKYIEEMK